MNDTYNHCGTQVPLDPETGLPELPDGYFWRIKRAPHYLRKPLIVQIRRRGRIFSKYIDEVSSGATQAAILDWAAFLVVHRPIVVSEQVPDALLGDYPPKKLGV